MNRGKELAKNTAILTFGKICTQFISFLLLPLYTAFLEPAEFGIVDLFNTYITLLVPLVNWQFDLGLFRFLLNCRNDFKKQKNLFTSVMVANTLQIIVYIALFCIVQNFISSQYKIFLAIDVVLNVLCSTLLQFSRGLGDNTTYAIASFISALFTVVLNIVFIVMFKMGAYGLFIAAIIAKSISVLYIVYQKKVWKFIGINNFNKGLLKELAKYSLPLVPSQLSWWVLGISDRTIVTTVLGININGVYSVANKFSTLIITFYNIFNMSWTETVSLHFDDDDRDEFLSDMFNTVLFIFSAACVGMMGFMPLIFPIMVNSKYQAAYPQIPILILAAFFQIVVGMYSVIYLAKKKTKESAKTAIYAATINILVDVIFIKTIGLYAASVSTLVSYLFLAIFRHFDVKKYVDIKLNFKKLLITLFITIAVVISYYSKLLIPKLLAALIAVIYAFVINRYILMVIMKSAICIITHKK